MSVAAAAPSLSLSRISGREAALWSAAGVAVLAMHLAVAYAFQAMRPLDTSGGPPPALMIELAPLPVAPATEMEATVPDNVQPEQAEPVDNVEEIAEAEPEKVTEAEPEPVKEQAEPIVEEIQPEEVAKAEPLMEQEPLEEVVPDVVEVETPEVAVPLPQPRPIVEEKPEPQKKPVEKAKEHRKEKKPTTKPVAAASVQAKPAPKAAAPQRTEGVASPRVSPARWQARVSAWLNRHKRYPSGPKRKGEEGTVQVAFTIDPSGRVTSSRVTRSSGNPEFDKAALDMLRRASPVPAPPPAIAKASMPISVPVVFNLR
ncbi:TonB family protein [Mesorhizobium sp. 1B3]|uniref:energy transducer TonB n=1 Tax=Mesorhizobium sp. 1B3 TaxID=3243599 RepID=UPI003D99BB43